MREVREGQAHKAEATIVSETQLRIKSETRPFTERITPKLDQTGRRASVLYLEYRSLTDEVCLRSSCRARTAMDEARDQSAMWQDNEQMKIPWNLCNSWTRHWKGSFLMRRYNYGKQWIHEERRFRAETMGLLDTHGVGCRQISKWTQIRVK